MPLPFLESPSVAAGVHRYYGESHQHYLAKNSYGYRCHANTGAPFPADA